MAHFLREHESRGARPLGRQRAAVAIVRRRIDLVEIEGSGCRVANGDALFVELPGRVDVAGPGGGLIRPTEGHRFMVSTETIDPHHLLVEMPV